MAHDRPFSALVILDDVTPTDVQDALKEISTTRIMNIIDDPVSMIRTALRILTETHLQAELEELKIGVKIDDVKREVAGRVILKIWSKDITAEVAANLSEPVEQWLRKHSQVLMFDNSVYRRYIDHELWDRKSDEP